jgi:hypothetical protein
LDSTTGSFSEYLGNPFSPGVNGGYVLDVLYGSRGSFWENNDGFLRGMPVFNVDRVQGATMMQYINDQGIYAQREPIAAFRRNGRPIENLHFGPGGYHWLQLPRQRFESMTASLDWMNFWLQGKENPDPARTERNARWRKMRDDWQTVQAKEAARPRR